jgi:hypothetical protein
MQRLRKILQWRALVFVLGISVLSAKLFSPYLHTHSESDHHSSYLSSTCSACEVESTNSVESFTPIVLPERGISQVLPTITITSALITLESQNNTHLRGPPTIS